MIIYLEVQNQQLTIAERSKYAKLSTNYLQCSFDFQTEDWEDTVKTAVFKAETSDNMYDVMLDENNTCYIPWEVLQDVGTITCSVYGTKENYRITTTIAKVGKVVDSLYGGSATEEPEPTIYEQLLLKTESAESLANSANKTAQEANEKANRTLQESKQYTDEVANKLSLEAGTVASVNGKAGIVNLVPADIGLGNVQEDIERIENTGTIQETMATSAEVSEAGEITIVLTVDRSVQTGTVVKFIAPCDSVGVSKIQIGDTEYLLVDAMGNPIVNISGETGGVFKAGAIVAVVLNAGRRIEIIPPTLFTYTYFVGRDFYIGDIITVTATEGGITCLTKDWREQYRENIDGTKSFTVKDSWEIIQTTNASSIVVQTEEKAYIQNAAKVAGLEKYTFTIANNHDPLTNEQVNILQGCEYIRIDCDNPYEMHNVFFPYGNMYRTPLNLDGLIGYSELAIVDNELFLYHKSFSMHVVQATGEVDFNSASSVGYVYDANITAVKKL